MAVIATNAALEIVCLMVYHDWIILFTVSKLRILRYSVLISLFSFLTSCEDNQKNKNIVPAVKVVAVKKESVSLNFEAAGRVSGSLEIQVRAQVGGILKERKFKEGQFVKKGDSLFLIDPVPYETTLAKMDGVLSQAESDLRRTKRDFDRMLKMFKAKAVSQKEYDDALSAYECSIANVNVAKANVKEAKINLEYTNVRAPMSGIVRKEIQTVGNLISTAGESALLTSIVQTEPLHVHFSIAGDFWRKVFNLAKNNEADIPALEKLTVKVIQPNGDVCPVSGKIVFADNAESSSTGTISLKAEIPNKDGKSGLMPGQFVRVIVSGSQYKNPVIPTSCVIATAGGNMVYVVDENKIAQVRPVKVKTIKNKAIVMSGLREGETVVCDGIIKVRAGSKVAPVSEDEQENNGKNIKNKNKISKDNKI